MIDGVKILCVGTDWKVWADHSELDFIASVSLSTGEVLDQPLTASLKGLKFSVLPSDKNLGQATCLIEGSLHRFHNKGRGNADNFALSDIQETVDVLKNEFGVHPDKAILQNLEFGLNIELPIPAKQFLSCIISMPDKAFTVMNAKKPELGKVCARSEYGIKIYDKEFQINKVKNGNLLRFEVSTKKARYLKKYGVSTLSNICQADTLGKLGKCLFSSFEDMIFYDGSIYEKELSHFHHLKLKDFCSNYFWEKMDWRRRSKQRIQYNNLMKEYGANDVKKSTLSDMRLMWSKLNIECTKKVHDFTPLNQTICAEKKGRISHLVWCVKTYLLENPKEKDLKNNKYIHRSKIHNEKSTPDCEGKTPHKLIKKCCTCGRDISHQKKASKYCSEKFFGRSARSCRDAGFIKSRRRRRDAARKLEEDNLQMTIMLLGQSNFDLIIYWNDGFSIKTTTAALQEVPQPIRSLVRVSVSMDGTAYELTTRRAKKLIKTILAARDG